MCWTQKLEEKKKSLIRLFWLIRRLVMSRKGVGVVSSVVANKDASCWTNVSGTGVARANYHGKEDCELSFHQGDEFVVTAKTADWLRAKNKRTKESGLCPISYIQFTAGEQQQRESHKDLLNELDNMFEETITAADAERKEDEEALKAAAALEAEFSFDNIMAEVMAMKNESSSSASSPANEARPTLGPSDLELSLDANRYSSEIEDDDDHDDLPVPRKPLPPPPPPDDGGGDSNQQQPPPQLHQAAPVTPLTASPRSVRRNLPSPSASPTAALPAGNAVGSSAVSLPQRRSAAPPQQQQLTVSVAVQPKSASSSPNVSRIQAARPIAKLLGDDGQMRCAKCSTVVSKDATFCKHCGSTLKLAVAEQCSKCKLILKPGVSVCGSCGSRTSDAAAAVAAAAAASAASVPPAPVTAASILGASSGSIKTPISPRRSNARGPEADAAVAQMSASSPNLSFKSLSPRRMAEDGKAMATPTSPRRVNADSPPTIIIGSPRRSAGTATSNNRESSLAVTIPSSSNKEEAAQGEEKTRVIMVGSGSSGGTPSLHCLAHDRCKACVDALQPGSRNRRRNPSLLIQHRGKNILIDCGKSFREGWIEVIEKYQVKEIHAVIISHAHADAFYGLDDLREVIGKGGTAVPVYAREADLTVIEATFPYLTSKGREGSQRFVANITFNPLPNSGPFSVCGLKFRAVPLPHGDCTALGFQFGPVVYFSDCSSIPDRVFEFLAKLPLFKVLIIDALFVKTECFHHLNLPQALLAIQQARPERAILTGCSHEFFYQDIRRVLKKVCVREKISVKMGYDLLNFSLESDLFE
jgi:phosphoribosyl 1,2-cyclic phosphodiesterase/RNA polymerase subunit RPABC4/transcription elongation factor Spt4